MFVLLQVTNSKHKPGHLGSIRQPLVFHIAITLYRANVSTVKYPSLLGKSRRI